MPEDADAGGKNLCMWESNGCWSRKWLEGNITCGKYPNGDSMLQADEKIDGTVVDSLN